jgi:signal peptidase I
MTENPRNEELRATSPSEDASAAAPETAPVEPAEETTKERAGFGRWMLETIAMVALAFLLAQGIKVFVVQPFVVPTGSMEPTIMAGDRVLSEKISYRLDDPEVGDIVVFDDPQGRHPQLIKRVIATEGQTVELVEGVVHVDGEQLKEEYLVNVKTDPGTVEMPVTVPEGHLWLMGDNRPNSGDSRYIGPQPTESITARAFSTYWPVGRIGWLE